MIQELFVIIVIKYACNTATHGTSNLPKHLKVCEKSSFREIDKKQKKNLALENKVRMITVSFKLVAFN